MITVTSRRHVVHNPALSGRPGATPAKPAKPPAAARGQKVARPVMLGDWVEKRAKPIALAIDRWSKRLGPRWATKMAGCTACSRRRAFLNRLVRDVRRWSEWRAVWRRLGPAWRAFYARRKASKTSA